MLSHFRPGPDSSRPPGRRWRCAPSTRSSSKGPARCARWSPCNGCPRPRRTPWSEPLAVVLGAAPRDRSALYALCGSDEPLVAGAANGVVSYFFENVGELDSALKAARRTLEAFEQRKLPYLQAGAHARISELCLQVERGEEARRHLLAALPVLERLGNWSALVGIRWWLVLASLQVGDVDEAEHWLEQTAPPQADEPIGTLTYGLGVRAEILLARGEVEAACACGGAPSTCWYTPRARSSASTRIPARTSGPWRPRPSPWWPARHGRLDLVEALTGDLPHRLSTMLANPVANPPPYLMELPTCGGQPAGAGHGGPRPRRADRRPAGHQVGGADGRPGRALPGSCGTSSRPCPPPGPARRPSRPTGRPTRTRCRRTPAWVMRSCRRPGGAAEREQH